MKHKHECTEYRAISAAVTAQRQAIQASLNDFNISANYAYMLEGGSYSFF